MTDAQLRELAERAVKTATDMHMSRTVGTAILALLDRVRDAEGRAAAVCCKGEPHTCDQEAIAACRLLGPLHRAARGGGVDGDVVHLSRLRTDRSEGGDAELSDVRQQ
jgi:hypothetical protein